MDTKQEIATIIKDSPGISVPELFEYFTDISYGNFSSMVSACYRDGDLRREPIPKSNKFRYFYEKGAKPDKPSRKMTTPTDAGLRARLDDALSKIGELEAWKAEAIKRFPDLDVDPLVIRARKIVSDRLRLTGDNGGCAESA